jgi:hydroxyacylglutathione hydrolase
VLDTSRAEEPLLAFTGGDLLVGSVGRPDLLGRELGEKLAPMLFDSLHEKILKLEDYVEVLPTHGSGSLCGKSISSKRTTTIGYERRFNEALQIADRGEFVRHVLSGNPGIPTYYERMRPANQKGAALWQRPEPRPLTAAETSHAIGHGALVIDTRHHAAFGGAHIPGSLNVALEPSLATWVGWLVDPETPVVLVVEREDDWAEVVTSLARIGYENIAGYLQSGIGAWIAASLPVMHLPQWSARELTDHLKSEAVRVLDVRTDSEWDEGYIPGAAHIRLEDLPGRAAGLKSEVTTAVVCGSGFRSSIASSILLQQGVTGVVNVGGGMESWDTAGYPKVTDSPSKVHLESSELS